MRKPGVLVRKGIGPKFPIKRPIAIPRKMPSTNIVSSNVGNSNFSKKPGLSIRKINGPKKFRGIASETSSREKARESVLKATFGALNLITPRKMVVNNKNRKAYVRVKHSSGVSGELTVNGKKGKLIIKK
ncbi:MAG: hypothetical protein PHP82_01870 [Candidatus ainarchaeum sp.]|nr:hypothetical protein [Candidatus ainarchaeum sp.]